MTLAEGPPLTVATAVPPSTSAFIALADSIGDGLVEIDEAGVARALNPAGEALLALAGGAGGAPAPAELVDALTASRAEGRPVLRDTITLGPGSRRIRIAATAVDGQPGALSPSMGLVALRDNTEERLLQERLLQSEKMASVGQLVSGVAHELNNPLTGVMGFAQLLLARDLDDTSRGQVRTIYGEAERAAKIVQNLLSFARRRKPTKEMADINALLAQVLELRSYDFTIRNISLDMALDPRMPRCWVDPDQVQQVFFNIVKNAEQAMIESHGGGRLTVRTEAITTENTPKIGLRPKLVEGGQGADSAGGDGVALADQPTSRPADQPQPSGVRITIADDGPGIPGDVQRRIFDPFFTTKEAGQGTGLGLTISYSIVDEHAGRVWAEPVPSGGSRFVIELPVGEESALGGGLLQPPAGGAEVALADQPAGRQADKPAKPSYRILVVDDEESIRLLLRDILEMDGHRVETGSSGIDAWSYLDAKAGPPDVIITDMKMPGMDGATFYREVRRRDPGLARRIIFITGDTVSPDTRAFLHRVTNPVLSKPFKIGPLRDAMETVLHGA